MATLGAQKENRNPSSSTVPVLVAIIGALATIIVTLLTIFKEPILAWFTAPDIKSLAIEEIPQKVFVFAGNDNPDGGWGMFDLIYDNMHTPVYQMSYSLPDDKYGYAGLVFQFPDGYDLSDYTAVEFTIQFGEATDKIDLFIKDIGNNNNKISIAGNGENEMNLIYQFSNFPGINFSAVKEIGVFASTDLAAGYHQVKVKNVHFVK
jgi:hypothetical protein